MILKLELNFEIFQMSLRRLETTASRTKGDMAYCDGVFTGRRLRVFDLNWKQGERRRTDADHRGEVTPDVLINSLKSQGLLIPSD